MVPFKLSVPAALKGVVITWLLFQGSSNLLGCTFPGKLYRAPQRQDDLFIGMTLLPLWRFSADICVLHSICGKKLAVFLIPLPICKKFLQSVLWFVKLQSKPLASYSSDASVAHLDSLLIFRAHVFMFPIWIRSPVLLIYCTEQHCCVFLQAAPLLQRRGIQQISKAIEVLFPCAAARVCLKKYFHQLSCKCLQGHWALPKPVMPVLAMT